MSLLKKLFEKKLKASSVAKPSLATTEDPAKDPNLIRVYDKFGRELFVTREEWKNNVLKGNIEKAWNNPDELYSLIVQSLNDEFFEEIIEACEQLKQVDPITERAATVLGIAYMKTGRLDDAERVLKEQLAKHGEDGSVLTNLAKVYADREQHELAGQTLWHALEVDPNQDNGMGWYEVMCRERNGLEAGQDALRRVAELPGSWRAQLWLARAALEAGNLNAALDLYKEALSRVESPAPVDLLQQMSGDLGNSGHLHEIIEWVEPAFVAEIHGLLVGNNLIKAHLDQGNLDAVRLILNQLYAIKRPDWSDTLSFWDTELAKARIAGQQPSSDPVSVAMLSIEGPLWMRNASPFASLLLEKKPDAPNIGILGSTATLANPASAPVTQLADSPGRLSRALPLIIGEQLHLKTNAVSQTLIPCAQGNGFVLCGKPYTSEALCEMANKLANPMDYMIYVTLDTASEWWTLNARLLRILDGEVLGTVSASADARAPGDGVKQILNDVQRLVLQQPNVRRELVPAWYQVPDGQDRNDYLLRLEQQLATVSMNQDILAGGQLSGEREILDGTLQLCVRQPDNKTARMLLIQTLRQMKKAHPDIIPEFKEKVEMLQNEYPMIGEIGDLASPAVAEVFAE